MSNKTYKREFKGEKVTYKFNNLDAIVHTFKKDGTVSITIWGRKKYTYQDLEACTEAFKENPKEEFATNIEKYFFDNINDEEILGDKLLTDDDPEKYHEDDTLIRFSREKIPELDLEDINTTINIVMGFFFLNRKDKLPDTLINYYFYYNFGFKDYDSYIDEENINKFINDVLIPFLNELYIAEGFAYVYNDGAYNYKSSYDKHYPSVFFEFGYDFDYINNLKLLTSANELTEKMSLIIETYKPLNLENIEQYKEFVEFTLSEKE